MAGEWEKRYYGFRGSCETGYEGVMTAPVHTTEERGKKSDYGSG